MTDEAAGSAPAPQSFHNGDTSADARGRMLALLRRHIGDTRVIDAMAAVPRERFVPEALRARAYDDMALPIGEDQTISQPLIVAMMMEALQPGGDERALEVGGGSGYAAAVLAHLASSVVAVERVPALVERARRVLGEIGATNVTVHQASDELGRREDAPYDAILVSAGAPHVPRSLIEQLADGGRLVVPIGAMRKQQLVRARKTVHGVELAQLGPCAFVPLIGADAWESRVFREG